MVPKQKGCTEGSWGRVVTPNNDQGQLLIESPSGWFKWQNKKKYRNILSFLEKKSHCTITRRRWRSLLCQTEVFARHSGVTAPAGMTNDRTYQQQLENALLPGLSPKLSGFLINRMTNHRTARPSDFMEHCKRAENVWALKVQKWGRYAYWKITGKKGLCSFKQNCNTDGEDEDAAGKEEVGVCTAMCPSSVAK